MKLFAFAGSLRKGSMNKKLIALVAEHARAAGHEVDLADFAEFRMPLYDGDEEEAHGVPETAQQLAARIRNADALAIASPEYNFSIPGTLKNAIDWISRDKPFAAKGKPTLLISTSPSRVGGNRGLWALRIPLEALGTPVCPEMYSLPVSYEAFDDNGKLADPSQVERFGRTLDEFLWWANAQATAER